MLLLLPVESPFDVKGGGGRREPLVVIVLGSGAGRLLLLSLGQRVKSCCSSIPEADDPRRELSSPPPNTFSTSIFLRLELIAVGSRRRPVVVVNINVISDDDCFDSDDTSLVVFEPFIRSSPHSWATPLPPPPPPTAARSPAASCWCC